MTDADPGYDETLAGQRLRLASLASFEDHIRVLRDQECDLEVEHIAARAALNSATDRLRPKVDPALASRIGRILEHRARNCVVRRMSIRARVVLEVRGRWIECAPAVLRCRRGSMPRGPESPVAWCVPPR
jgi:hypothetical protein